jgi:hypothetical protein
VPASDLAGAGMSRHLHPRNGAGETFVSFIDEMDSSPDSIGIDVPESVLGKAERSPSMQNDTRIAVDLAKAVSRSPSRTARGEGLAVSVCPGPSSCRSSPSSLPPP